MDITPLIPVGASIKVDKRADPRSISDNLLMWIISTNFLISYKSNFNSKSISKYILIYIGYKTSVEIFFK